MTTFLVAWALCMVAACFVITLTSIAGEARALHASKTGRLVRPGSAPRAPRFPIQRPTSSAAAVVHIHDAGSFDAFLAELIVTPHVEEALR